MPQNEPRSANLGMRIRHAREWAHYGRPRPAARLGLAPVATSQSEGVVFPNDVAEDVIPFAEKNYRISARADDRAIAGLSMGGNQTLEVGLTHLDTFHYIGAFSPSSSTRPPSRISRKPWPILPLRTKS